MSCKEGEAKESEIATLVKYGNDRPGKAQTTPLVMTQQI
jgi:hypothetical protein